MRTVLWRLTLVSPLLLGHGCASAGTTDSGLDGAGGGTGGTPASDGGGTGAGNRQGTGASGGGSAGTRASGGQAGSATGAAGKTSAGGTTSQGQGGTTSQGQGGTTLLGGGGTTTSQGQGGTLPGGGGTTSQAQGGSSTTGSIPTTCAEADGTTGCCGPDGNLYYCSSNAVKTLSCSGSSACGWDASKNYYSCGGTDTPPASAPMACGASSATGAGGTSSGTGAGGTSTAGTGGTSAAGTGGTSTTGAGGSSTGPLSGLDFAIVGDTRPANEDDTAGYPTAIITKIWQQVQAQNVPFAVATGDYQFASPSHTPPTQMDQLNLYLGARQNYTGPVYFTMGNHECTGATADMCGPGSKNGTTLNLSLFTSLFLQPIGQSLPYYTITQSGPNNSWTAKFVIVALNYWNDAQSTWLTQQMAIPTTYTFVVRHEGWDTTGITSVPLCNAIIQKAPMTLLIAGHTHTYEHEADYKEVIVGTGGAPLSGNINYGYVIARQQSSGAIQFQAYDTTTNAVIDTFAVNADGSAAP